MSFGFPLIPAKAGTQGATPGPMPRRKNRILAFAGMSGLWLAAVAAPAFASPVELVFNPIDDDERVTLGDIFEGAGSASGTFVAARPGPSVVLDAGRVQSLARQAGLDWANATGLRRIVVRQGAAAAETAGRPAATRAGAAATVEVLTYARSLASGDVVQPEDVVWAQVQAHLAPSGTPQDAEQVIGLSARRALRSGSPVAARDLASPQVIARNDMVQVAFISGGVRLTVTGRATRNAALGEAVPILNTTSGRTIDAVASGPGQAVAGPAATAARQSPAQFASAH